MAHFGIIGRLHEGRAEIYARIISNFVDNVMAITRIANNTIFTNIGAYKAFVQREKDDVKEFSRIAA